MHTPSKDKFPSVPKILSSSRLNQKITQIFLHPSIPQHQCHAYTSILLHKPPSTDLSLITTHRIVSKLFVDHHMCGVECGIRGKPKKYTRKIELCVLCMHEYMLACERVCSPHFLPSSFSFPTETKKESVFLYYLLLDAPCTRICAVANKSSLYSENKDMYRATTTYLQCFLCIPHESTTHIRF